MLLAWITRKYAVDVIIKTEDIEKLDKIVNKYNNIYPRTIKLI